MSLECAFPSERIPPLKASHLNKPGHAGSWKTTETMDSYCLPWAGGKEGESDHSRGWKTIFMT